MCYDYKQALKRVYLQIYHQKSSKKQNCFSEPTHSMQANSITDRHHNRRRKRIGEKSPVNIVRLTAQNFDDLQRTSRYLYAQETSEALHQDSNIFTRQPQQSQSPHQRQQLPKLRARYAVSLEATSRQSLISQALASEQQQAAAAAHQIMFKAPGQDMRLNQRVSLDYEKIDQILRKREARNTSKHEKIFRLLNEQQPQQQNALQFQAAQAARTSRRNNASNSFATATAPFHQTQPNFQMFRTVEASSDINYGESEISVVPPHFTYPETNMALTCNYFSSNDYTRKQTIQDIKQRVIEERSTRKQQLKQQKQLQLESIHASKEHQEDGGSSDSCEGGKSGEKPSTKDKQWFNKTGTLNSPSPALVETLPIVMSQRRKKTSGAEHQDKTTSAVHKTEKSQAARTETPDGCKGVQIDSSMDMQEEERFKGTTGHGSKIGEDLTNSSVLTPKDNTGEEKKLQLVPQIHMSTHLFNGDYLVQTVNQNTPSIQASPNASRVILPNQLISNDSSPGKKQKATKHGSKFKDSKLSPRILQSYQNKSNERLGNQHHHHVTYFAGPQINQINLHVHFSNNSNNSNNNQNGAGSNTVTSPPTHPNAHESKDKNAVSAWSQAQKIASVLNNQQNESDSRIMLSPTHGGIDHGSKETLNQSSSKILQQNAANSRQAHASGNKHESPMDYTRNLNKYSSLHTQHLAQSSSPSPRIDKQSSPAKPQLRLKQTTTSGEILVSKGPTQRSILGLDLNSNESAKSSIASLMKNKLSQPIIEGKEMQTQTQQISELDKESQNEIVRDKTNFSKMTNNPGRTTVNSNLTKTKEQANEAMLTELSTTEQGIYDLNDESCDQRKQTEEVINQILSTLSQQKKSATIKITTHGKPSPTSRHSRLNQDTVTSQTTSHAAENAREGNKSSSVLPPQSKMSIDTAKQSKMRRSKQNRANTIEPKAPLPHLHIANYVAKKFDEPNSGNFQQKMLYNTIHGSGFGSPEGLQNGTMRSATVTQGPFHQSIAAQQQNNDLIVGLTPLSGKIPKDMYRTIMQPGARWNSLDFAPGATTERPAMRFDPYKTNFSLNSSLMGERAAIPRDGLQATLYRSLYKSTQTALPSFSLESRPEIIAATNNESSVLFKVPPNGKVGRFRPRQQRRKETWGERNTRLGHLATRTSLTKIKGGMRDTEIAIGGSRFVNDGVQLKPEMLQTNTTIFKPEMQQEFANLEQTMIPSPFPKTADKPLTQKQEDQVIYEESANEAQIDQDDHSIESHLSHNLTTFDSHQSNNMVHLQKALVESDDNYKDLQVDSKKETPTKNLQSSRDQSSQSPQKYKHQLGNLSEAKDMQPERLQQIMGNLSQRIAYDKIMLEKIKEISSKQQQLQMPQNKQAIVKNSIYPLSPSKIAGQKSRQKKLTIDGTRSNGFKNSLQENRIKENEFLEGQSIYTIMQNSTWSMLKPPGSTAPTHVPPTASLKIVANKAQSNQQYKTNQSHIVVVQTPETPYMNKQEDLKQRLDIKIRCPSQLLLPEVITAINRKLTLTISLIYFDGTQSLTAIQNRAGPRFIQEQVALNQQGFVLHADKSGQNQTKWNVYDDMFRGQLKLDDLNFMQRNYIVEIELTDPRNQDIYLLRYLTFNQMSQTVYPKIFITIMQHLSSKKRPLRMFDSMALEVLDMAKEPSLQDGMTGLDKLFEKLVVKDMNYTMVMKQKPRIECPPIRMKGIILESPKRKVQIKGISEFISLSDGLFNRPKIAIPQNQQNTTETLPKFRESQETLHPGHTDSQYVAVPLTNHVLPDRTLQGSELSIDGAHKQESNALQNSLNSKNTKSNRNMTKSPTNNTRESPLGQSVSRNLRQSPTYRRHAQQMKLNHDSASRILIDPQQHVLDPCMQVKRITETRLPTKTPPRRTKEEVKPINKQQFHVDPNQDKGIDCSFEALGSSEGRHSVNEDFTPPGSAKHKRQRRLKRFSSSVVDEFESRDGSKLQVNEVETIARLSRQNLNFGSNMSELEDEHAETFGQTDRLQSIFTMNKKESDLHEQLSSGMLMIRGCSNTEVRNQLRPNRSKDLHFGKKTQDMAIAKQMYQKPEFVLPKGILPKDIGPGGIKVQSLEPLDPSILHQSHEDVSGRHQQDAAMSTDYDELLGNASSLEQMKPKMMKPKEPVQKSIVNILAEELIKDPKSPSKHRVSNLSQLTKKTMPRRSNLRHALADEKSKQLLQNNDHQTTNPLTKSTLQIQRKKINENNPQNSKSPRKSPMPDGDRVSGRDGGRRLDHESVESEINSMRRDSVGSQTHHALNPTLTEISPEIIIVNQKKKKKVSARKSPKSSMQFHQNADRQVNAQQDQLNQKPQLSNSPVKMRKINFEKGGKPLDMTLVSEELALKEQASQEGTIQGD